MSESTVIEWLDENGFRAYPLLSTCNPLFNGRKGQYNIFEMIVDANLMFYTLPDHVYIERIKIAGSTATITITGQENFIIDLTANFPVYTRIANGSLLVVSDKLKKLMAQNITIDFTDIEFEPSVMTEQSGITLGLTSLTVGGTLLTSGIEVTDGYQFSVIPNGQILQLEAGRNEGLPLPCGVYRGTTNDCATVVSSVSGVGPTNNGEPIELVAGPHVKIYNDPDNHRVYIGLDFVAADVGSTKLLPPV